MTSRNRSWRRSGRWLVAGLGLIVGVCPACRAAPTTDYQSIDQVFIGVENDASAIETCMRERGFDYIPPPTADKANSNGRNAAEGDTAEMNPTEFAEQLGFGISLEAESEEYVDPNSELFETMSVEEDMAWSQAMWEEPDPCAQAGQDRDRAMVEFQERLGEVFVALDDAMWSDPRIAQAEEAWQHCVSELGYPYSSVSDINDDFSTALAAIERDTAGTPTPKGADDLESLQDRERSTAVALLPCTDAQDDTIRDVRREYEQRFIAEHLDVMLDIRDG